MPTALLIMFQQLPSAMTPGHMKDSYISTQYDYPGWVEINDQSPGTMMSRCKENSDGFALGHWLWAAEINH